MRIAFFGEDSFSDIVLNSLIGAEHDVCLVVTPYYKNNIYKRLELTCKRNNIVFLRVRRVNSEEVAKALRAVNPELCVVSHFERLIKKELLRIPTRGFINLHPSLLPDYRGMTPQHWPIVNREKVTGITIHYVDEGTDTGDIILQRMIPLTEEMYVSDLQRIWREEYRTIVVEAIKAILAGAPKRVQRNLAGRYYGRLSISDRRIDLSGSVYDAHAKVRAFSLPYAGAICGDFIVYRAHISNISGGGQRLLSKTGCWFSTPTRCLNTNKTAA